MMFGRVGHRSAQRPFLGISQTMHQRSSNRSNSSSNGGYGIMIIMVVLSMIASQITHARSFIIPSAHHPPPRQQRHASLHILYASSLPRGGTAATENDIQNDGNVASVASATAAAAAADTTSSTSSTSSSSSSSSSLWWDHIPMGLPDSILGIAQAYRECTNPRKVNICVGAYRDHQGQPYILPSVLQAEWQLLHQSSAATTVNGVITNNKEYLPIEGDTEFIQKAIQFAYGTDIVQSPDTYIAAVQTLSGTGACRIGGHFLQQFVPKNNSNNDNHNNHSDEDHTTNAPAIYIPVPTWGNHWKIFNECGLQTMPYRYYDSSTNQLDFNGLMEDIQQAPDRSIILLHACAHNPTGCDPTPDQWIQIANVMAAKQHVCFFDSAYQGFASGNAEADAWSIRYFVQRKDIPVLLAQSFAKNFGLYGERCGTLSVVCQTPKQYETIVSQLKNIIRPMYSSPPKHGSSIVKTILNDNVLAQQYYDECRTMAERIGLIRQQFVQALRKAGSVHDWSHVSNQIGMFAFTGMNANMCDTLTNEYAIYLTRDGRISLAGLNEQNIEYVANAVHAVTFNQPITTTSTSL